MTTTTAQSHGTLTIPDGAEGGLYIFALDPPTPAKLGPRGVGVLPTLLGYPDLDPDFGEIVSPAKLGTTPLHVYIEQTYGVPVDETQTTALREARGRLAIIRRRAFGEGAKTLTLAPGIWFLLSLDPPPPPSDPIPLPVDMVERPARQPSRVIPALVGLVAFLLTLALVLWVML